MRSSTLSTLLFLAGAIPALAAPPGAPHRSHGDVVPSLDGNCGGPGGFTCLNSFYGNCCGASGKCGSDAETCGAGCQAGFGYCSETEGKVSLTGACGGVNGYTCKDSEFGNCCSKFGYCGSGAAYCSQGCQEGFGDCGKWEAKRDVQWKDSWGNPGSQPWNKAENKPWGNNDNQDANAQGKPWGKPWNKQGGNPWNVWGASKSAGAHGAWPTANSSRVAHPTGWHNESEYDTTVVVTSTTTFCPTAHTSGGADVTSPVTLTSTITVSGSTVVTTITMTPTPVINHYNNGESGSESGSSSAGSAEGSSASGSSSAGSADGSSASGSSSSGSESTADPAHNPSSGSSHYGHGAGMSSPAVSGQSGSASASGSLGISGHVSGGPEVTPGPTVSKPWGNYPPYGHGPSGTTNFSASFTPMVTPSASHPPLAGHNSSTPVNNTGVCTSALIPEKSWLDNCIPCEGQGWGKHCGGDINTDWYKFTPKTCQVVHYEFDITNTTIAPDGVPRMALLVNGQMPGPPIRASWGDTVVIKVNNKMENNGTSLHFHGLRQLNNSENDGVPSVTQCPIAPGESMTYTWVAENYGTSWYHSHYVVQTWAGVMGPLIIDGPHSAEFDEELDPLFLMDWSHETVDTKYARAQNATQKPGEAVGVTYGGIPTMDNGLINGLNVWGADGSANQTGTRAEFTFKPGKKHLLRIVNGAIQASYKFSIDGHKMKVIQADFVPIEPYWTDVLNVNIGQRYNVIVEADQPVGTYWMRSDNQETCSTNFQAKNIKAVVKYEGADAKDLPTSTAYTYTEACIDEPYASIVPVVAIDPVAGHAIGNNGNPFDVVIHSTDGFSATSLYRWFLSGTSFQSQFGDPTLYSIYENGTAPTYSGNLLIDAPKMGEWVYIIIESLIPLPHPIHLHGHDFFILAAGRGQFDSSVTLNTKNPPRRDTAMLPSDKPGLGGYLVVGFQIDNPGTWLMHCHIGWHVSMGFALQIVELQDQIKDTVKDSCKLEKTCKMWNKHATDNNLPVWDSGV